MITSAWFARAYSSSADEHAVVVAQRRVDVDQRDDRRRLLDARFAEDHARHRDRVGRVRPRRDRAHERLVGEREQRVDHVEVPRVERLVVRLADRPARRVELRERLSEPDEVLEVLVRRLAALEAPPRERTAVDGAERHVPPADVQRAIRVARLQVELARRLRDLLDDPVWVEPHELPVDVLTGIAQGVDRLVVQEVDAELAHDPAPAAVELLHRRVVEDLVPRELVDQQGLGPPGVDAPERVLESGVAGVADLERQAELSQLPPRPAR